MISDGTILPMSGAFDFFEPKKRWTGPSKHVLPLANSTVISEDLPLNISRKTLRQNRILKLLLVSAAPLATTATTVTPTTVSATAFAAPVAAASITAPVSAVNITIHGLRFHPREFTARWPASMTGIELLEATGAGRLFFSLGAARGSRPLGDKTLIGSLRDGQDFCAVGRHPSLPPPHAVPAGMGLGGTCAHEPSSLPSAAEPTESTQQQAPATVLSNV